MLRRIIKLTGLILLIPVFFVLIIAGIYFILPDSIEETDIDLLYPTVNIVERYEEKIVVENYEVYELMQSALSLTEAFQSDENLLNKFSIHQKLYEEITMKTDYPSVISVNTNPTFSQLDGSRKNL